MVATHRECDDHELIAFCRDPEAGLTAIIAVHDTAAVQQWVAAGWRTTRR